MKIFFVLFDISVDFVSFEEYTMTSYLVAIVKIYEVIQIALTVKFSKRVLSNKSLENVSDKRMFKNFICRNEILKEKKALIYTTQQHNNNTNNNNVRLL